jgi:hypothetical protein
MLKFGGLYEIEDPDEAAAYLRRWQRGAARSRLESIIDFAHLVREYGLGIVRWCHSRISNGLLGGLHSLVQADIDIHPGQPASRLRATYQPHPREPVGCHRGD